MDWQFCTFTNESRECPVVDDKICLDNARALRLILKTDGSQWYGHMEIKEFVLNDSLRERQNP